MLTFCSRLALPGVCCLAQGVGKKLYTPLDFTAYLDMRPYLSSSVMHARLASHGLQGRQQGRGALPAAPPQQDADPCMYELYTVVCHRGNLQVRCTFPVS
jgi:ubiquitin carboxyl-terminal hydrolase 22/27/51